MIKKNEVYEITMDGMTSEGQGVGRVEGFVVFVDGALPGELVSVHIVKVTKTYAEGRLKEVLKASPHRVEPYCPSYERCGGCTLQHFSYEGQLVYKKGVVKDALERLGGLDNVDVSDTIGMADPQFYRNKAQYPFGTDAEGLVVSGYYAKRSHSIIPHTECVIQDKVSGRIRRVVEAFIAAHPRKLAPYDEATGHGVFRHLMTRVGFETGEVMVVLVCTNGKNPLLPQLAETLVREIPEINSIYVNVNPAKTNVILGEQNIKLHGADVIHDIIGDLKFRISPLSFFQVNPVQTKVLYGKALEFAGLSGSETVYDLYCGTGTIGLFMARNAEKVIGVEFVEDAVNDAKLNAQLNGIENAEFFAGEAETLMPAWYEEGRMPKADVVILDPPRKGCDQKLLETLVEMAPDRIVYVSCNPATLARDLKFLTGDGYVVQEVQPVDMFPWTSHVETVVLITRV